MFSIDVGVRDDGKRGSVGREEGEVVGRRPKRGRRMTRGDEHGVGGGTNASGGASTSGGARSEREGRGEVVERDGGGVDSRSHSLLSPPTTSNSISPASHPHLSGECSTQSSRGGSAHPDLWLSVLNEFGSIRASLAIWIGEVKFHFPRPGRERPRILAAVEAYSQAIIYLVAAWEICGTWLAIVMLNTKWGRMVVMEVEEVRGGGTGKDSDGEDEGMGVGESEGDREGDGAGLVSSRHHLLSLSLRA